MNSSNKQQILPLQRQIFFRFNKPGLQEAAAAYNDRGAYSIMNPSNTGSSPMLQSSSMLTYDSQSLSNGSGSQPVVRNIEQSQEEQLLQQQEGQSQQIEQESGEIADGEHPPAEEEYVYQNTVIPPINNAALEEINEVLRKAEIKNAMQQLRQEEKTATGNGGGSVKNSIGKALARRVMPNQPGTSGVYGARKHRKKKSLTFKRPSSPSMAVIRKREHLIHLKKRMLGGTNFDEQQQKIEKGKRKGHNHSVIDEICVSQHRKLELDLQELNEILYKDFQHLHTFEINLRHMLDSKRQRDQRLQALNSKINDTQVQSFFKNIGSNASLLQIPFSQMTAQQQIQYLCDKYNIKLKRKRGISQNLDAQLTHDGLKDQDFFIQYKKGKQNNKKLKEQIKFENLRSKLMNELFSKMNKTKQQDEEQQYINIGTEEDVENQDSQEDNTQYDENNEDIQQQATQDLIDIQEIKNNNLTSIFKPSTDNQSDQRSEYKDNVNDQIDIMKQLRKVEFLNRSKRFSLVDKKSVESLLAQHNRINSYGEQPPKHIQKERYLLDLKQKRQSVHVDYNNKRLSQASSTINQSSQEHLDNPQNQDESNVYIDNQSSVVQSQRDQNNQSVGSLQIRKSKTYHQTLTAFRDHKQFNTIDQIKQHVPENKTITNQTNPLRTLNGGATTQYTSLPSQHPYQQSQDQILKKNLQRQYFRSPQQSHVPYQMTQYNQGFLSQPNSQKQLNSSFYQTLMAKKFQQQSTIYGNNLQHWSQRSKSAAGDKAGFVKYLNHMRYKFPLFSVNMSSKQTNRNYQDTCYSDKNIEDSSLQVNQVNKASFVNSDRKHRYNRTFLERTPSLHDYEMKVHLKEHPIQYDSKKQRKEIEEQREARKQLMEMIFRKCDQIREQDKNQLVDIQYKEFINTIKTETAAELQETLKEIDYCDASALKVLFQYKLKAQQENEDNVLEVQKEYQSGITDPSRYAAQQEKSANMKKIVGKKKIVSEYEKQREQMKNIGVNFSAF